MKIRWCMRFLTLSALVACSDHQAETQDQHPLPTEITALSKVDPSFDVEFSLNEVAREEYRLVAELALSNGAYVVSPFSPDTVYGHFNLSLESNANLRFVNELYEFPHSRSERDPILEGPVNFVRGDTRYSQTLESLTEDDFEVRGQAWFVLEPSCVPYEVAFAISQRDGELTIAQEEPKSQLSDG